MSLIFIFLLSSEYCVADYGFKRLLPMLWASKSTTYLRQYPILRLLWKAAPRKSHSNDVATMVKALIHDSQAASSVILSIHRASMLGNYSHAHKQPPLPLRFKIYRMDAEKSMLQTISKVFFNIKLLLFSSQIQD